ncbi:MAG TPA: hypothetical protein VD813_15640, partial [Pseudonocardia sp.]|nr:hypothetical protein [Pseudonocardia sp.]
LGETPSRPWWRAYADHTTFERPTVLVESDGERWLAFLSGIPSARRDAVGTVIRSTVVLEGEPGDDGPVLALVAGWLADHGRDTRGGGPVSAALDAAFAEADVERLVAAPGRGGHDEVRHRLDGALRSLPRPAVEDTAAAPGNWIADSALPNARALFLGRVAELLAGAPGRALMLNLVSDAADVAALLTASPGPLAVLAVEPDVPPGIVDLDRALRASPAGRARDRSAGAEPAKKAPAPPRGTTRAPAPPRPLTSLPARLLRAFVPLVLAVAVAVAVVVLVTVLLVL